jgi:hypothetical protein
MKLCGDDGGLPKDGRPCRADTKPPTMTRCRRHPRNATPEELAAIAVEMGREGGLASAKAKLGDTPLDLSTPQAQQSALERLYETAGEQASAAGQAGGAAGESRAGGPVPGDPDHVGHLGAGGVAGRVGRQAGGLTMHLHPGSEAMPAPAWIGDEAESVPSAQPAPRGQRHRRPTVEEQAAAIEVLRERARRGTFAGELPPSAEEIRADQARRGALRKDAALVGRVGRSAAAAPRSGRV